MNEKNIYNYWNQLFEELGINQFIFIYNIYIVTNPKHT